MMKKKLMSKFFWSCLVGLVVFIAGFFQLATAKAEEQPAQPDKSPIKIGSTVALTGTAAKHGLGVNLGMQIYFDRINHEGGIDGRKIQLITLDNKYDPTVAGPLARRLIDEDKVIALVGLHGSAIVAVVLPIAIEKKTLLFGVWSGPNSLYKMPPDRYAINHRPSYGDEVMAATKGLLSIGIKPEEFAFFTQNDPFGDSVYNAAIQVLKQAGYKNAENLPYGRYTRNTLNVESALATILEQAKNTPPKVFILGGLAEPNQKFIALARKEYPHALFVGVSGLIDPKQLAKSDENHVISTQVVPSLESNLPAVHEYREDLKKYGQGATPSYTSLNTYLAARLFVKGLREAIAQNKLTREGLIDVFENMNNVDIGIGLPISFSKINHTGMHTIWVTIFKNGEFVATNWPQLKAVLDKGNG